MKRKHFWAAALTLLIAAGEAHADSTQRFFTRLGKTTYVSQRCYCGQTAVEGFYTGKSQNLRIAAFDCATGLTFYGTLSGPSAAFRPNLFVSNACYRWVLIAPEGRVEQAKVVREVLE